MVSGRLSCSLLAAAAGSGRPDNGRPNGPLPSLPLADRGLHTARTVHSILPRPPCDDDAHTRSCTLLSGGPAFGSLSFFFFFTGRAERRSVAGAGTEGKAGGSGRGYEDEVRLPAEASRDVVDKPCPAALFK